LLAFASVALRGGPVAGQNASRPGQFSSRVNLVEVYASVIGAQGPVAGLTRDNFIVEEDGEKQTIAAFAVGDVPLSVAIGIDRSFSMSEERLKQAIAGARHFVGSLRPEDRVMVVAIGSEVETVAPLLADRAEVLASLTRLDRWGTTPLYDATIAAIDAVQIARGRRALILLSDGDDRGSRATASALVEYARRKDVLVYPVALGRTRPAVFAELATVTGGRSFFATGAVEVRDALATIARELRGQYLLGYSPSRLPESRGAWRSIRVRVNRPGVRVRARDGYMDE
jgi:Ca-activated chloride channel family protein